MLIRRLAVVLGILFLVPSVARADGHRAGLGGGISFARGSWLTGGHFLFEHVVPTGAERYLYVTADYSFHDGDGFKRQIFLAGANVTGSWKNVAATGRLVVGSVWGDGSADLSWSYGAAIDIVPGENSPLRQRSYYLTPRVQVDHIIRKGSPEGFARVSIDLVVKFP